MSLLSPEITPVSSRSEVQYVVLQNVATMTIKRRVSWTDGSFQTLEEAAEEPHSSFLPVFMSNRECLNRI